MDFMRRSPRDKKPISDVKFVGVYFHYFTLSLFCVVSQRDQLINLCRFFYYFVIFVCLCCICIRHGMPSLLFPKGL